MSTKLKLVPFIAVLFFTVSGGAYGLERSVSSMGPGLTLVLIIITPIIWSLPIVLMVAELVSAMPIEGGYYYWVTEGLGKFWGFQEAWWSWLFAAVDMAIYPVLFGDYAKYLWPNLNDWIKWFIGLGVIFTSFVINLRGAASVGSGSLIASIFTLVPFLLLFAFGVGKVNHAPWKPFAVSDKDLFNTFSLGLAVTMWNYQGWDNVSTFAGEVDNPRKTFPRGLALTIPIILISYLIALIPSLGATTNWVQWKEGFFPHIAEQMVGSWLAVVVVIGAFGSSWSLFNSQLLYTSRLPYVLAKEGYLPNALTLKNRGQVPWVSLAVCSLLYAALARLTFQTLVLVDVLMYSAGLILEFVALIVLRRKRPDLERPFLIPGGRYGLYIITTLPILLIVFIIMSALIRLKESFVQLVLSAAMIASGFVIYSLRKHKAKRSLQVN